MGFQSLNFIVVNKESVDRRWTHTESSFRVETKYVVDAHIIELTPNLMDWDSVEEDNDRLITTSSWVKRSRLSTPGVKEGYTWRGSFQGYPDELEGDSYHRPKVLTRTISSSVFDMTENNSGILQCIVLNTVSVRVGVSSCLIYLGNKSLSRYSTLYNNSRKHALCYAVWVSVVNKYKMEYIIKGRDRDVHIYLCLIDLYLSI